LITYVDIYAIEYIMNDYTEIERAIGNVDINTDDDTDEYEGVNELTGTNMVAILQQRVDMLMSENIALNKRIEELEAKVMPMYVQFVKTSDRPEMKFASENHIRESYVSEATALDMTPKRRSNTDSFVNVDTGRSASSPSEVVHPRVRDVAGDHAPLLSPVPRASTPTRSADLNPFTTYFESTRRTDSIFKSNSATAPMGYVRKGNVWGTALTSFLTAAMRYYITKKNASMLMVDEGKMAAVYSRLVPVLYENYMAKSLPGVSDPLTFRLSQAISRTEKNQIPLSYAHTWEELERTQEGRDIMSIMRVLVVASKAVPEAMVYPVSQLIPYIHRNLTRQVGSDVVFAIDSEVVVKPTPSPWESWCLILKMDALVKYVKYRLSGMTTLETVDRMTSEMKPEELTEKKNWDKLVRFNPVMMAGRPSSPS
jgi:hypothetical protein